MTPKSAESGMQLDRPAGATLPTRGRILEHFYEKWLATHLGLDWFVELAHSGPGHEGFTRNLLRPPNIATSMAAGLRGSRNVMASTARYPEPVVDLATARYPLLSLDFDCPSYPRAALMEARRLALELEERYGVDAVLVKSGFKGAHLHIPLKSAASHSELVVVARALAIHVRPLECNGRPVLDWSSIRDPRHLIRIPYTLNIRSGARRLAVVLEPRSLDVVRPRDFEWGRPLDPRLLGMARVESGLSLPRELKPPRQPGRLEAYQWIERVLERGLPDGRKRFILYAAARYLVNVKGLAKREALEALRGFIEASCRAHGNCARIYDSWLASVLRGVARGGYKPWSLERLRREDPGLYQLVAGVAGA